MTYPIIHIKNYDEIEQIGTKEKFWFYDEEDRVRKLFKIGRSSTGENWAEKVTSELAHILNIPCASYDFAIWNDKEGVVSPIFVPQQGRLVHGNEILAKIIKNYPSYQLYKVREYKLSTVLSIMTKLKTKLPIGLNKLENLSQDKIKNIFGEVPEHLISHAAINFALAILHENKIRLINTKKGLAND